ncbi:MAG: FAD binding domain-containing protein [Pseudomonadota bacterium]
MKPAAFEYRRAHSLSEALGLLAEHAEGGKILAGGQSLVPAMNFRLARPEVLIDLNTASELDYIQVDRGQLLIGALARHAHLDRPIANGPVGRILPEIAAFIAHLPIRMRGTFAGSLAHADPAAEWCAVALGLEADIVAESASHGRRAVSASSFFRTIFTTTLHSDELIKEIRLPLLDDAWRCGFAEFSRRAGDYALAMAFVVIRLEGNKVAEARIAIGSVAATPVLAPAAAAKLIGTVPDHGVIDEVISLARDEVEVTGDIHGSADYRRHLVGVMTKRAIARALV